MSHKWAISLPLEEATWLGPLRCRGEIEVCPQADAVWLRGPAGYDALELKLRALPGRRFEILPDNQLLPHGSTVPSGYCPSGPWLVLRKWMSLAIPTAALSGTIGNKLELRLVRGGQVREANVLRTTAAVWRRYASEAPQVRLESLAFAVSEQGHILVRGTPLPPLEGERLVEQEGIAIPAGYTWEPALDSIVIRGALRLPSGDLGLFQADGFWDRVRGEDFVRVTRSAARLSTQEI